MKMVEIKKNQQAEKLNTLIKKLQSQKNILLKEIGEIEERLQKTEQIYRRYLPYILELVIDKKTSVSPLLKDLKDSLKKKASLGRIEHILKKIQDGIYREDPDGGKNTDKKTSFFSGILKKTPRDDFSEFKKEYIDFIDSLKASVDKNYTDKLNSLSKKITEVSNWGDINDIHDDLFSFIKQYIDEISADREKIAAFVQEIIKKIFDIQANIDKSHENNKENEKSNKNFSLILDKEMGELKHSLDISKSLEDLKSRVSGTLTNIESALKNKKAKDQAIKESADNNRAAFQSGFAQLKNELAKATKHSKELEIKLNRDPLTGAFNRRAYNKRIEDEMDRFLRYGTIFSMLMLDVDYFKKVNDNYGHAVGDKCLQEIIKRAGPYLRKSDMLARYGGEEFVVIMPETDGKGALAVAEKIRQTIEKLEFIYKKDVVKVTVSIGVSQVKEGDKTASDIFDRADTAVYQAKEGGRNMVVLN